MLIPMHVRNGLDKLRELYGASIVINNPPHFVNSGIRTVDSPVGAKRSTHKVYRGLIGFDLKCSDQDKLRKLIEKHYRDLSIAEIEDYSYTKTWTHCAFSAERPVRLRVIKP